MKKPLLLIAVGAISLLTLLLAGCSKKDSGGSYSMKSVAGAYKLTASTVTSGGITVDYMPYLDDCEKDDLLTLNADSTYVYTDAGTTCTPDGSTSGQWYISGSYLIQDGDTVNIKSFNGTALVLTFTGSSGGVTGTSTTTLTKQ
ncbi:MAG TPA: lipocalin family protein [Puia sp.]|jgi:hypothetical protein|nr:lipocalin family protein [Puia sp.]